MKFECMLFERLNIADNRIQWLAIWCFGFIDYLFHWLRFGKGDRCFDGYREHVTFLAGSRVLRQDYLLDFCRHVQQHT